MKAYDSINREVLYHILIEFGESTELVRLIKMCLNETYSKVHIDIYLITFLSRMVSDNGMLYHHCFRICH
jgi:hypothetical protein